MKAYIDCGAFKGETVKLFRGFGGCSSDFKIYAFEPNPYAKVHKRPRDYILFKKAVWIKDGHKEFYTNKKRKACVGATLMKEKTTGGLNKSKPMIVETIDFSQWLLDTFKKTDTLIVKLDIEGAEFTVVDKMIADGSIEYINKIFVETHGIRIGLGAGAHQKLLDKLAKVDGLVVVGEFAHLTPSCLEDA